MIYENYDMLTFLARDLYIKKETLTWNLTKLLFLLVYYSKLYIKLINSYMITPWQILDLRHIQ